jgi:NitT/TauT family transport system substrate-binding protein
MSMSIAQTRRRFLTTLSLAGAAGFVGAPWTLAAEGALETTTVRLTKVPGICLAPQYVAEELLRAEGFTEIRYVDAPAGVLPLGKADFTLAYASNFLRQIDAGDPITLLSGVMVGCFELFGNESIHGIPDLKGKTVGVQGMGSLGNTLVLMMAAQVGLDPDKDIHWVADPAVKPIELFIQGKIDAFLAFPPEPQDLRARHTGRVILNSATDRPWSQYFCCLLGGDREYVHKYPIATKRVLRAILKASDLCVSQPERAAQQMVERGFTTRYDYALQTLSELPYDKWREYDPEDTLRFYALRLREAGFIKSSPNKIITESVDWHFLNELKRELKV